MAGGRLFHARNAATGKARSPRVNRCTDGTTSIMVVEERRWWRPSTSALHCLISQCLNLLLFNIGFMACIYGSLSLSLHFNGHYPGEPGLAGVYWSKGWWRWWWQLDYWSYRSCKALVKSSSPTNQHPVFLQAGCPSCCPANSVKALKGKISHSMDLLTRSSPGDLQTLSLTTNSSWLPWGRVAMPLISRLMPVLQLVYMAEM